MSVMPCLLLIMFSVAVKRPAILTAMISLIAKAFNLANTARSCMQKRAFLYQTLLLIEVVSLLKYNGLILPD